MHPLEYDQRTHKLTKLIIDYFGHRYFLNKSVLDLGCFNGDLANALARVGARMTAVDARKEHIVAINKKYPHIRTVQLDLDKDWPFADFEFDVVLSIGVMCHLKDYAKHLNNICSGAEVIILETEALDFVGDSNAIFQEDNVLNHLSYNGQINLASSTAIQNKLSEIGATFKRIDNTNLNIRGNRYDWQERNTGRNEGFRRIWFIRRDKHIAQKVLNEQRMAYARQEAEDRAKRLATEEQQRKEREEEEAKKLASMPVPHTARQFPPPEVMVIPEIIPINRNTIMIDTMSSNKKFVIVIPSYNNEKYCEKNMQSAIDQNYDRYRIIFTDDCSSDETFNKVSAIANASNKSSKITCVKNTDRKGALENLYNMIHSCDDDEIILTLDGDDWFPDAEVLNKLNKIYSENDVWITYGQYKNTASNSMGHCRPYDSHVITNNSFRSATWNASHLRTFYTWLFKRIKKEDLMQDGKFFVMTWDFAIMFPMLEMSGEHSRYIADILYIYNDNNPINDHKVSRNTQAQLDRHIRGMQRYSRTEKPIFVPRTTSIGLIIIATGKYDKFIQDLITSADNNFMTSDYDVSYFVFTDSNINIVSSRNIERIHIDHKPFPHASMDRFKHFTNHADKLEKKDYLYYVDVDCKFVDKVKEEILGDLVGVRHCGYYKTNGPSETNQRSQMYDLRGYKPYYGGGFSGGRSVNYLQLAKWCSNAIETDITNGIIPIWHDETALNKYFLDHPPTISLSPSYHYPQGQIQRYQKMWQPESFTAKILLLDKNHKEVR
jgi:glycosyltransferase involved in cell wall biosynthesis/SAM-dependent methyltransferase